VDKIKVCLTSINYPMSMARYFERALERRNDVELITVGPHTGTYIPWQGGMTVLPKYDKSPTHSLPREFIRTGKVNPQIFERFDDMQDIDLWLEVDAGFYLDPRPTTGIVAHVATDPHALNYDRQRQLADYFFSMQLEYAKEDDIYLPYAFSPDVHYPMDIEKEYDACLIGLHYEHRNMLISRLIGNGLNVHYSIGPIFDEYREINNKSKIGLNWASKLDLNARAFELPAMGICPVQNTVPDMKNFFVAGEHYLEFTDVDSAEKQVMAALEDDDMRQEIADNAYRKVQNHTYDARVAEILERVGLI
jgi:glycosyltransferase involved in cell wall biosynthesis